METTSNNVAYADDLLTIEDLEERTELVHGVCACTTSCGCTSCSCVAWASS